MNQLMHEKYIYWIVASLEEPQTQSLHARVYKPLELMV